MVKGEGGVRLFLYLLVYFDMCMDSLGFLVHITRHVAGKLETEGRDSSLLYVITPDGYHPSSSRRDIHIRLKVEVR